MTIGGSDPIPSGYFGGGAHLASDDEDGLRQLLNRMKTAAASLGGAFMGLGSLPQDSPSVGDHVEWDTASIRGDLISLSSGVGQAKGIVTLTAGHTYRVSVGVDIELDTRDAFTELQVYDRTQGALLVPNAGATKPRLHIVGSNAVTNKGGLPVCTFEFTPSVDTDFDVRIASVGGGGVVDQFLESSWLTIDVLG